MGYTNRFKAFQAPSRYIFKDPDTKRKFEAPNKKELIQHIQSYREQNRLKPIQALEAVLENYWCSLPENAGKCETLPLKRGWFQYLKGGVSLLENIFMGEKNMVSQEEADIRSEICSECPHNVFPDKGPFVKWSDEIAGAATGGRQSSKHNLLGNCEICSCPLRAKVFHKHPKPSREEKEKMPSFCWQKNVFQKDVSGKGAR